MEVKICTKCNEERPLNQFHKKGKSTCARCCYCRNAYTKQHYQDNKAIYIARAKAHSRISRASMRERYWEYKNNLKCQDCGETNPIVLQFDHLRDKVFNISAMVCSGRSWKKILEEIEKCEVVCANCHMIRTAQRAGHYKDLI